MRADACGHVWTFEDAMRCENHSLHHGRSLARSDTFSQVCLTTMGDLAWLASLSCHQQSGDQMTVVDTPTHGELDDVAALVDMGYHIEAARNALEKTAGNIDEALLELRTLCSGSGDLDTSRKRRREDEEDDLLEVEGFLCRRRGKDLVLWLSHLRRDGPVVGRTTGDGLRLDGVNQWDQELYFARRPRPCASLDEAVTFNEQAASASLAVGDPWCWESFASAEELRAAHAELEALACSRVLSAATSRTSAVQKARTDRIAFLDLHGGSGTECPPCCLTLFRRLEGAASRLTWPGDDLLCPQLGMAAVYDGAGSYYATHRDNEFGDGQWVNHRTLTAVAYVNPSSFQIDGEGGELRCHVGTDRADNSGKTARRVEDIRPRGGIAVLFPSRTLLHEVRPTRARRYALTLWFLTAPRGGVKNSSTGS